MSNDFFGEFTRLARNSKARSDAVNAILDQIVAGFDKLPTFARLRGGAVNYATAAGTDGAYVVTLTGPTALFEGLTVKFKAPAANTTGPCSINLNGLGVVSFKTATGADFSANAIASGAIVDATYDGAVWRGVITDTEASRAAAAASASAASASASAASGSASAAASSAASALASKTGFDELYRGASDDFPDSPIVGTLFLNTSDTPNVAYVYTETGFAPVVTVSVGGIRRQDYTSQTGTGPFTVSGGYDSGDLYKNGTLLRSGTDWTPNIIDGTFTLAVAAISSDVLSFRGYLANDLTDIYTKAEADARFLNITNLATARSTLSVSSTAEMNAAILAALPVGATVSFAMASAPTGWLKMNGAAVLISSYSALTTAIYCGDANNGTAEWGYKCTNPASPSATRSTSGTYIVLPDARGRFPRAFDDGAGVDSGRTLWSYQADDNKAHTHTGTTATTGAHTHTIWMEDENYDGSGSVSAVKRPMSSASDRSANTQSSGDHAHTFTTDSTGTEARPKNWTGLWCIKFS